MKAMVCEQDLVFYIYISIAKMIYTWPPRLEIVCLSQRFTGLFQDNQSYHAER